MHKLKLSKKDRIKSKKIFEAIIYNGKKELIGDIFVRWLKTSDDKNEIKAAFTVPKKKFKRAVDRNRIKRLLREAYRLNKHILYKNDKSLFVLFTYIGNQKPSYAQIEDNIKKILNKINEGS